MERMVREINCPFCLSILTRVAETKKPGVFFFQCLACGSKLFIQGEKQVGLIGNNYNTIKNFYKTPLIKELLDTETPSEETALKCPLCQGKINLKKCKKTQKKENTEKSHKFSCKEQSFYIFCQRGCGHGFVPERSIIAWRKTTSLLAFV